MTETDKELRRQLTEARDKVRRELEIVRFPTNVGGGAPCRSLSSQTPLIPAKAGIQIVRLKV